MAWSAARTGIHDLTCYQTVALGWRYCKLGALFFPGTGLFPPSWPRRAARAADHARSAILHVLTSVGIMQYLLGSLATMVFIGLLAQWSRKSKRAEISLLIVLVFLSLLLFATGALLGVVWVSGQMPPDVYPQQ